MPYTFPEGNVVWEPVDIIALLCQPGYMSPDDWRPIDGCAIVLAESGGNPLALGRVVWNPGNPTHLTIDSLGMFQLLLYYHTVTGPYPDVPPISVADCFDPHKAWVQTWKTINKGRKGWHYNWTPWSAYTSGSYDKFLTPALLGMRAYRASQGLPPGPFG